MILLHLLLNIDKVGYEWVTHSFMPKQLNEIETRVKFGGSDCKQPLYGIASEHIRMSFGALSAMLLWL